MVVLMASKARAVTPQMLNRRPCCLKVQSPGVVLAQMAKQERPQATLRGGISRKAILKHRGAIRHTAASPDTEPRLGIPPTAAAHRRDMATRRPHKVSASVESDTELNPPDVSRVGGWV